MLAAAHGDRPTISVEEFQASGAAGRALREAAAAKHAAKLQETDQIPR